jgi:hypothetical protein
MVEQWSLEPGDKDLLLSALDTGPPRRASPNPSTMWSTAQPTILVAVRDATGTDVIADVTDCSGVPLRGDRELP